MFSRSFVQNVICFGLTLTLLRCELSVKTALAQNDTSVAIENVRLVFDDGNHNAFTDLIRFRGQYYLAFRNCPDGHMVHPTASIIVMQSRDLKNWKKVYQFSVPLRDTRDPHFLAFQGKLFVYTGTWYCGKTSPDRDEYDLNKHLGYAVHSDDGVTWSEPTMLEGTFGHYVWRASSYEGKAYLCGRRKHQFDVRPRGEGPNVESAMLVSEDGLVWKTHSLFQMQRGDETAFRFDGSACLGVARRGRDHAELLRAEFPFKQWERKSLGRYIGGPLLAKWGDRWFVGGRNNTANGPKTVLAWLGEDGLEDFAVLPSGGDNSYPGFVALSAGRAVVSWYSSHEKRQDGSQRTAIYMADLVTPDQLSDRKRIEFTSSADSSTQPAYLSIPRNVDANSEPRPLVVSLHSWSAGMEQRQLELEALVEERGWFCLQPNFRGRNDTPDACGSPKAQQDIVDAVDFVLENYPVNSSLVFLTGTSGGGHMTMMMSAKHPDRWLAASAWVGISNLETWYSKHKGSKYGDMMELCCGGAPGESRDASEQYSARSPIHFLSNARDVAIDIAAGIYDGHSGSVPVRHSLEAFNEIAKAAGAKAISEAEMQQLALPSGRLKQPQSQDEGFDPTFVREYYLRRQANKARVTIFDGGHEGIAEATIAWFDEHLK